MPICNMPESEYRPLDRLNATTLKLYSKCPANVFAPFKTTAAMTLGTNFHHFVLEGEDSFHDHYYVTDKVDGRTTEGKAKNKEAIANANGREIITTEDMQTIANMANSIYNQPSAMELLDACPHREQVVLWDEDGIKCKAKIDAFGKYLVDIKTTQNSAHPMFMNNSFDRLYHMQMSFYLSGLRHNFHHVSSVCLIAVENTAPYTCEVYEMTDEVLEWGESTYKELMRGWADCKRTNAWPSYRNGGITQMRVPFWAKP